MTDIQAWLDRGCTIADQATEGPWEAYEDSDVQYAGYPPIAENLVYAGAVETPIIDWGNGSTKADAEFIADARTRLPQALNALQAVMEIHKPYHADHYYVGMNGGSLHRFVLRCEGCEESGGVEGYPCPTVRAIQNAIKEQGA